MRQRFPALDLLLVESGGDNLAATFSPELVDATIYVIDVAEGDKIPRKGGPGITRSDLLVINKIDLAPHVGADLEVMERDARGCAASGPSCSRTSGSGTASRSVGVDPVATCCSSAERVGRDGRSALRFERRGAGRVLASAGASVRRSRSSPRSPFRRPGGGGLDPESDRRPRRRRPAVDRGRGRTRVPTPV